jgi:hypothetical protein
MPDLQDSGRILSREGVKVKVKARRAAYEASLLTGRCGGRKAVLVVAQ